MQNRRRSWYDRHSRDKIPSRILSERKEDRSPPKTSNLLGSLFEIGWKGFLLILFVSAALSYQGWWTGESDEEAILSAQQQRAASAEQNQKPKKIEVTHRVKPGDTLWKISRTYQISLEELMEKNQLQTQEIFPGQKLKIREEYPNAAFSGEQDLTLR